VNIRRRIFVAISLLLTIGIIAVLGYRIIGGPSVRLLDAIYMAVVTLTGLGYSEFVDTSHSTFLRIFNIFVILFGVSSAVYVFSETTAFLIEGELSQLFVRRRMNKRIQALKNHFIVCGVGETGRYVIEEFEKTGTPHVIVESSEDVLNRLRESRTRSSVDILYLIGDATDERVLQEAGLDRASGLIAGLPSDKDNLVITVVTRQRNQAIRIVSRCTDLSFSERMLKAGANSTVSPNHIGGLRLASEVLRPSVVDFLDLMLQEKSRTLRVEEITVGVNSPWIGKEIRDLNLGSAYNILLLALKQTTDAVRGFAVNPPGETTLQPNTVMIVLGEVGDLKRARADAAEGGG
jgi:voltage-gated potassium channel